jgi:hypothetical protein
LKDYKYYLTQSNVEKKKEEKEVIEIGGMLLEDKWNKIKEWKKSIHSINMEKNWIRMYMEEMYKTYERDGKLDGKECMILFTKMNEKDWQQFGSYVNMNQIENMKYYDEEFVPIFQQWVEMMIMVRKHQENISWKEYFEYEDISFLSKYVSLDWLPKMYYDVYRKKEKESMFQVVDKYGTMNVDYGRISRKMIHKMYEKEKEYMKDGMLNMKMVEFSKYKSYLHQFHEEWERNKKGYTFSSMSNQSGIWEKGVNIFEIDKEVGSFGALVYKWFKLLNKVEDGHEWKQIMMELFYHKRYTYSQDFLIYIAKYMEYYVENMRLYRKENIYEKGIDMDKVEKKISEYYMERTKLWKKCVKQKMYEELEKIFGVNPFMVGGPITIDTEPKPNMLISKEIPKLFEVQFN